MAGDLPAQRAYRALCPNCGAPVEFRSAASASAICSFCRSTLVRDGDALRRIGQSAELFDDHSPLQLGAGGRYQGAAFTLIGRLQRGDDDGRWTEWHALFDSGRTGWLSEDNGRHVFAFEAPLAEAPARDQLRVGGRIAIDGRGWSVASIATVRVLAAGGELPRPPLPEQRTDVVDLRNEREEVGTLEYLGGEVSWAVGRSVTLAELGFSGLAEAPVKTLPARSIECPNCGASLAVTLQSTKSIVCHQCKSVVDVSGGIGAELQHYQQSNAGDSGLEPLLPLGSVGRLALSREGVLPWQVVGYLERCDVPADPEQERSFWREYLLYHRTAGFAFLVDALDGWSWVSPCTGAPKVKGDVASYRGIDHRRTDSYTAVTTYVLGEFYWRVTRGQRSLNIDYAGSGSNARQRLNREQAGQEVVWSAGQTLEAEALVRAFNLPADRLVTFQRDVAPTAAVGWSTLGKTLIVCLMLVFAVVMIKRCDGEGRCDTLRSTFGSESLEYRQCLRSGGGGGGGGSYGGYSSSGGGHK